MLVKAERLLLGLSIGIFALAMIVNVVAMIGGWLGF